MGKIPIEDNLSYIQVPSVRRLLADRYHRHTLYCLRLYATPVSLPDIAHQLTIWRLEESDDEYLDERLRIYEDLYHDVVPELVDAAVVTYHQQTDMVEWGDAREYVAPHLDQALRREFDDLLRAEDVPLDETSGIR